jgi:hypothetical protein
MNKKTFILLMLSILSLSFCSCTRLQVRPITIKVVDRETKSPLANIPVYYGLESVREEPKILFIIPNPSPLTSKIEMGEKAYTNNSGEVSFGPHDFLLRKSERISQELIYINLDLNDRTKKAHFKVNLHDNRNMLTLLRSYGTGFSRINMVNPSAGYRGSFVSITEDRQTEGARVEQKELADITRKPGGLQEKEQFLVIELGRN